MSFSNSIINDDNIQGYPYEYDFNVHLYLKFRASDRYCAATTSAPDRTLELFGYVQQPLPAKVPYFWAGIKAYDLVSGDLCLKSSYYLNKERALELFPMLKSDKLKGAIVYYDGSHNDSRMCISIAVTAARLGATVANHTRDGAVVIFTLIA